MDRDSRLRYEVETSEKSCQKNANCVRFKDELHSIITGLDEEYSNVYVEMYFIVDKLIFRNNMTLEQQ